MNRQDSSSEWCTNLKLRYIHPFFLPAALPAYFFSIFAHMAYHVAKTSYCCWSATGCPGRGGRWSPLPALRRGTSLRSLSLLFLKSSAG